jgi:NitT/TauT family transport system permease protein
MTRVRERSWGLATAGLVAGLLGVWEAAAAAGRLDPLSYPAPSVVAAVGWQMLRSGEVARHLWPTVQAILGSFLVAAISGAVLGLVLAASPQLHRLAYPPLLTLYALPKVTVFPIFMLFFGLGLTQRVLYGAFFGVFPVLVNTVAGIRGVDRTLVVLARSLGMTRLQYWRKILFPSVLPLFATGLRMAFVYAGVGVLLSEMFVSASGIGQRLVSTAGSVHMGKYFVYVATVFLLFALATNLLRWWEERLRLGQTG